MFKDMIVLEHGLKILNQNYRSLLVQNQQKVSYIYVKSLNNLKSLQKVGRKKERLRKRARYLEEDEDKV